MLKFIKQIFCCHNYREVSQTKVILDIYDPFFKPAWTKNNVLRVKYVCEKCKKEMNEYVWE